MSWLSEGGVMTSQSAGRVMNHGRADVGSHTRALAFGALAGATALTAVVVARRALPTG